MFDFRATSRCKTSCKRGVMRCSGWCNLVLRAAMAGVTWSYALQWQVYLEGVLRCDGCCNLKVLRTAMAGVA